MASVADATEAQVDKKFPVMEIFGPVIQGEGQMIGKQTHFIRFGGCDFACSWCDTKFAVDPIKVQQGMTRMNSYAIMNRIGPLPRVDWVTFSGGNPLLFDLDFLLGLLFLRGFKVAVETQGSVWRDWASRVNCLTVSPKGPSSGMHQDMGKLGRFLGDRLQPPLNVNLKIVVADVQDLEFAREVHRFWPLIPMTVQPCNTMAEDAPSIALLRADLLAKYNWLSEAVMREGSMKDVLVLPQLHALAWGNERAR